MKQVYINFSIQHLMWQVTSYDLDGHAYTYPLVPCYHLIDRDIQIPFQLRLSTFSQVNIPSLLYHKSHGDVVLIQYQVFTHRI